MSNVSQNGSYCLKHKENVLLKQPIQAWQEPKKGHFDSKQEFEYDNFDIAFAQEDPKLKKYKI